MEYEYRMLEHDISYYEHVEDFYSQIEKLEYNSFGVPVISMYYIFDNREWNINFRNPVDFSNNDVKCNDKNMLKCCNKLADFINNNKQLFSFKYEK